MTRTDDAFAFNQISGDAVEGKRELDGIATDLLPPKLLIPISVLCSVTATAQRHREFVIGLRLHPGLRLCDFETAEAHMSRFRLNVVPASRARQCTYER
jgi:hypothetical protein